MEQESKEMTFEKELEILINRYSIDNQLNTPDYILADKIIKYLNGESSEARVKELLEEQKNLKKEYFKRGYEAMVDEIETIKDELNSEISRLEGKIKHAIKFIEEKRSTTPGLGALLAILGKYE